MVKPIFVRVILVGLFLTLAVQASEGQTPTINTLIGGGGATHTPAYTFAIGFDPAVAVDPGGNVYIADASHGSVYRVNLQTSTVTTLVGNGAAGNTVSLANPTGLAADGKGNLFIADATAGVVYRVATSGGTPQIVAGCGTVNNPACFPVLGTLGDGGPATSAFLSNPSSVSVDGNGNLFIADTSNDRIRRVNAATQTIMTIAGGGGTLGDGGPATSANLGSPSGVLVDSAGDIFIADSGNLRVREVCALPGGVCGAAGNIQTVVGSGIPNGALGDGGPATGATLVKPVGLAFDSNGNLYVADNGDNRVRFINMGSTAILLQGEAITVQPGNIQTLAGTGAAGYADYGGSGIVISAGHPYNCPFCAGDGGIASMDPLNGPAELAVSGSLLFVADSFNYRVRVVNIFNNNAQLASDEIETVAGDGLEDFVLDGSPTTDLQLIQPMAVSEDAESNVYVGENFPRVLEANAATGTTSTIAGNGIFGFPFAQSGNSPLSAQLQPPNGLFLDNFDDVFVSDGDGGLLGMNDGTVPHMVAGTIIQPGSFQSLGPSNFGYPGVAGTTGDNAGNLYFSETIYGSDVYGWPATAPAPQIVAGNGHGFMNPFGLPYPYTGGLGDNGPATNAQLGQVSGICLDAGGNLFITDLVTFLVRVVNTGSSAITVAGVTVPPGFINTIAGGGYQPPSNTLGHYYYTTAQVGDGGPATSAFVAPAGCFVDNLGNIFIADENDDRVRLVDHSTGIITTVAGSQDPGLAGDGGPPGGARLNFPTSIWGDQAGNLLISDAGNNRVREITGILPVPNADIISCQTCALANNTTSPPPAVVTLQNSGNAPLLMSTGPSLTDSKDFSISGSTCPVGFPGLKPQGTCIVSVTVPGGAVSKSASTNLVFHDNAYLSNANLSSGPTPDPVNAGQLSGYLQSVAISSTYTPPAPPSANFSPLTLTFTAVNVAQSISVTNSGSSVLNVSGVTVPVPFAFQSSPPPTSCSSAGAAFSLLPGASCNIYIVFTSASGVPPTNPVVTISDNTVLGTEAIPLLGYALVPTGATTFSISNSAPVTVNATFSLVGIAPTAGVNPVCVITPAGLDVNCTYNSTAQTITANVSIPSCVETGSSNVPKRNGGAGYLSLGVVGFALLLPWGRSRSKRLFLLITVALLSGVVCGMSACTSTNQISTSCVASVPPGTAFNLNVTANAATAGQFPSLTLTKDDVINVTQ
jgi:sugar lactone lactonase YvrE